MTDRELLELAAKAYGVALGWFGREPGYFNAGESPRDGFSFVQWNPLTDDGDALRLAVKLRIPVSFPLYRNPEEPEVHAGVYWDANDSLWYPHSVSLGSDPYAATRRAIVRSAAEIGRAMK